MKNITYMLLSTLILVALPAGCASKKKNAKANEVTINKNADTVSIQFVGEEPATALEEEVVVEEALSKF